MIDVIITTYNRRDFLKRTVESFIERNKTIPYRLFILDDHSNDGTVQYLADLAERGLADVHLSGTRKGITYGLDHLWNDANFEDFFFSENQYLCYLQDDMVSMADDWLLISIRAYEELKLRHNVGFFSGYHAIEHPVQSDILWHGNRLLLKKSTSATNLIAEKAFWMSIGYVPQLNPDGTQRGMPSEGRGSHVDIYLTGCYSGSKFHHTHAAKRCSVAQGKNVLVVPDLLDHIGVTPRASTWRHGEALRP